MADTQTLYLRFINDADDVVARKRRIDERLDDIVPVLKKALERSDALTAGTAGAALGRVEEEVQDALELVRQAVSNLNELNKDRAFVAQRMVVLGTATRTIASARDALAVASEQVDALLDAVAELKKRSVVSQAAAQRGLAQLRTWLRGDENLAMRTHAQAEAIVAGIRIAVAQRDEAALDTQRRAFDLLTIQVKQEDPKRLRNNIAAWARHTIGKGLAPGADTDLAHEVQALYAKVDELEKRWIAPLARMEAEVMAALVPALDARKAASELKLDPALASRFGKILNDTPLARLEAALERFRKAHKLPGSGREMLASLRRARLLG